MAGRLIVKVFLHMGGSISTFFSWEMCPRGKCPRTDFIIEYSMWNGQPNLIGRVRPSRATRSLLSSRARPPFVSLSRSLVSFYFHFYFIWFFYNRGAGVRALVTRRPRLGRRDEDSCFSRSRCVYGETSLVGGTTLSFSFARIVYYLRVRVYENRVCL